MSETILELKELKTYFSRSDGLWSKAVDGVSFSVKKGETLCVVGESGCGKSMTALSIMGLLPKPRARIVGGQILLNGQDLTALDDTEMCKVRGRKISMIFQEPMTSLNPVKTIGYQVTEAVLTHTNISRKDAMDQAIEMLRMVGISRPESIVKEYPHQLSGGMRQRVMIAMALICRPDLLIADEPTTALDVTIQAQVLSIIREMKQKLGMAVLFITHDFGVVAEMADSVAVMYAGQIVEFASVRDIFKTPMHPYTQALMASIPFMDQQKEVLYAIAGTVPDASRYPDSCRFAPRCEKALNGECTNADQPVPLVEVTPGHYARCILSNATGATA